MTTLLHGRLGGRIEHVPGVIIDQPVRSLDEEGAMTGAERSKVAYWRKKMAAVGVAYVRLCPSRRSWMSARLGS